MGGGRGALRLFLWLVLVALPPLIAFAVVVAAAPGWLERVGPGTGLLIVALFALLWAGLVSAIGGRSMRNDARELVALAGGTGGTAEPTQSASLPEQLAAALDERNRQIAELAAHVREAPIEEDAEAVARSTVVSATSVTHDPTWSLVVLRSPDETLLPIGTYTAELAAPEPVEEVHRWASTLEADESAVPSVSYATGPWGAFVVVEVAAGEGLRANLMAPWEGRGAPSRAERELLSLLGQNSATAIEHALLYARLRTQTEELNRMAAVQTDFLRGVTHDLQTPLTSIGAVASELRSNPGLSAQMVSDLDTIGHQADRLRRMVSQLLVVSRLEAGRVTPRVDVFRPEPVIRRCWNALRADRSLELRGADPDLLVVADPDRFEQVLWALLDNALKYSRPETAIHIRLETVPNASSADEPRLAVTIRDEGTGMDEEAQRHAFEQFYRAPDASRHAPDGSGIGLYAARGLVEAMGGRITLESRLGRGTSVRVELPAESVPSSDDAATSA